MATLALQDGQFSKQVRIFFQDNAGRVISTVDTVVATQIEPPTLVEIPVAARNSFVCEIKNGQLIYPPFLTYKVNGATIDI